MTPVECRYAEVGVGRQQQQHLVSLLDSMSRDVIVSWAGRVSAAGELGEGTGSVSEQEVARRRVVTVSGKRLEGAVCSALLLELVLYSSECGHARGG